MLKIWGRIYPANSILSIFLHAICRLVWDEQIRFFSKSNRVVAVDLPGFGASKNHRRSWTMDAYGADVAAVINHLDLDQVILVGFSMGCSSPASSMPA